jgi:hypothetical protein
MDFSDNMRQRIGAFTPLESAQMKHDEEAVAYYKEQRELIADQKQYTRTII